MRAEAAHYLLYAAGCSARGSAQNSRQLVAVRRREGAGGGGGARRQAPALTSPEPAPKRLDQRLYLVQLQGHGARKADVVQALGLGRRLRCTRRWRRRARQGCTLARAAWRGMHHRMQGRQAGGHRGQQLVQRALAAGRRRH